MKAELVVNNGDKSQAAARKIRALHAVPGCWLAGWQDIGQRVLVMGAGARQKFPLPAPQTPKAARCDSSARGT